MFCKKCGATIPEDADFCTKCGAEQNENLKEIVYKDEDKITCPKCGSTQITSNKKGFSAGKAIGGAVLTGGIGLLFGLHGSGKIKLTCLMCGNSWMAGKINKQKDIIKPTRTARPGDNKNAVQGCLIMLVVAIIIAVILSKAGC